MSSDAFRVPLTDLPESGVRAFPLAGISVLLVRTAAGVFAIENRCSHAQQELEGGRVRGVHIFCPAHGVRFDLRTGCPSGELTRTPVRTFPVRIEGDMAVIDFAR